MISDFNVKLENVGVVNNANINIAKINVIAGDNSTGKSTLSKILYSFLRSNSKSRKDLTKNTLINELLELTNELYFFYRNDSIIAKNFQNIYNEIYKKDDIDFRMYYDKIKDIYGEFDNKDSFDYSFSKINRLINIYVDDGEELFNSIMNFIVKSEFSKSRMLNNNVSFSGKFNDISFNFSGNLNSFIKTEGGLVIEDVFYLQSITYFDLLSLGGCQNTEHVNHLFESIKHDNSNLLADEINNEKLIKIEKELLKITGGSFVYDGENIIFRDDFLMKNTASCIKQIGLVQMLLATRSLKENSFLIIDEPEVGLHPDWQMKFARILLLLARDLKITLYINTHSPILIEAVRTFSEKYAISDETNFYYTYPSRDFDKRTDIDYISFEDLNIIYNFLGRPYEILSKISIENQFKLSL